MIKSLDQVNLLHQSSLESKFDEVYNSDEERGPWCDIIGLDGEQDYEEYEIAEIQVEGVIKDEDINISKAYPADTDEMEDNPSLLVDKHIPIKEDAVTKLKILELKEELKKSRTAFLRE